MYVIILSYNYYNYYNNFLAVQCLSEASHAPEIYIGGTLCTQKRDQL